MLKRKRQMSALMFLNPKKHEAKMKKRPRQKQLKRNSTIKETREGGKYIPVQHLDMVALLWAARTTIRSPPGRQPTMEIGHVGSA